MRIILESENPSKKQKEVLIKALRELIEVIKTKEINNFTLTDEDDFGKEYYCASFFGEEAHEYLINPGHGKVFIEFDYKSEE